MRYDIEVTDSYGGEANYSWVRRYSIECKDDASDLAIMRKAKAAAGYNGHRCTVDRYGDSWTLRPAGQCVLIFITYREPGT
jgi:hypothetical protein